MQNDMMKRRIIHMMLAMLCMTACGVDVEEVLLSRSALSLTIKGETIISFDENTCQLGYNTGSNEYRVYDEKLTSWYIAKCSAMPTSEGQEIKVDLEYTTQKSIKSIKGLECKVEKISSDGLIWLWNKDRQIGIILKQL